MYVFYIQRRIKTKYITYRQKEKLKTMYMGFYANLVTFLLRNEIENEILCKTKQKKVYGGKGESLTPKSPKTFYIRILRKVATSMSLSFVSIS